MRPITINVTDVVGNQYSPARGPRVVVAGQSNNAQNETVTQTANVSSPDQPDYSQQQIEEAVNQMNRQIQQVSREIQFSVDKSTDRVVIKVIDRKTNELIRQIPSEEMLNLAEHLGKLKGVLLKEKA